MEHPASVLMGCHMNPYESMKAISAGVPPQFPKHVPGRTVHKGGEPSLSPGTRGKREVVETDVTVGRKQ